jgi:hypothetical protein
VARHLFDSNPRSLMDGIAVRSGADRGKGNALYRLFFGECQARAIAGSQQLAFAPASTAVDRAHRMKNEARGKTAGSRYYGTSGWASTGFRADLIKFLHDRRASGTMNSPVHTTAACEGRVRRVYYGIRGNTRDVAYH